MLTVDDYSQIRRAHRDGMSVREIARRYHRSRRKVREALKHSEPGKYTRRKPVFSPKLGAFHEWIRQLLAADEESPPKQRHTAHRIFERLRDELEYAGGYDAVRRFVNRERKQHRETFIPLSHDPGQRLEADFGQIYVDFPEGRRAVSVLVLVWSYSNCPFALAVPTEKTEAILEGMVRGFEFFECVPREVWWDNPKTVATELLTGRDRRLNERYAALASHYVFEPLFCLPAHGNEKPYAENRVKNLQRRWSTPVPRVKDLEELNAYLRECSLKDRERTTGGKAGTVGERFAEDRRAAAPLPARRFEPCISRPGKVDKFQFVRFETVSYSVPRPYAYSTVTVRGYVDHVEIVAGEQVVASHRRSYERGDQVVDPRHYLASLGRRPAALDHSNVFHDWKLPAVFEQFRARLEERHGTRHGVRQFVRVLQLLNAHPIPRVQRALEEADGPEGLQVERIIRRTEQLAARDTNSMQAIDLDGQRADVAQLQVPVPDLKHFDRFLSQGDDQYDQSSVDVVTREPEATAVADDRGRVRETGAGSGRRAANLPGVFAPPDRTGSGGAAGQYAGCTYQTSVVPGREGPGHLRLFCAAFVEQAEGVGTVAW
jgi:transposase